MKCLNWKASSNLNSIISMSLFNFNYKLSLLFKLLKNGVVKNVGGKTDIVIFYQPNLLLIIFLYPYHYRYLDSFLTRIIQRNNVDIYAYCIY